MTAVRDEASATLRALPQVAALRRFAVREATGHTRAVDRLACSPLAPAVRVALLLEVAHRAVLAAASVTAGGPVPVEVVRAVSPRAGDGRRTAHGGHRLAGSVRGLRTAFGPAGRVGRCAPGRCAPVTGWEPRVVPELDGSGEWDG